MPISLSQFIYTTQLIFTFLEALMQGYSTNQPTPDPSEVNFISQNTISINGAIALIIFVIPITLCLGFNTYKRYRAAVLRQQIATLEKLWLLENKNKKA